MSREIGADGGNVVHCVTAAITVRIPLANQLFLSGSHFVRKLPYFGGGGVAERGTVASLNAPFAACCQHETRIIDAEMRIPHENYLGVLVRQAFFQFVEDVLGFRSEFSASNEIFCRFYAAFAIYCILQVQDEAVLGYLSEVSVVSSYAEHDQIAVLRSFLYLSCDEIVRLCSRECQVVKDGCNASVAQRVHIVLRPIVAAPVALRGIVVVIVTRAVAGGEESPRRVTTATFLSLVGGSALVECVIVKLRHRDAAIMSSRMPFLRVSFCMIIS